MNESGHFYLKWRSDMCGCFSSHCRPGGRAQWGPTPAPYGYIWDVTWLSTYVYLWNLRVPNFWKEDKERGGGEKGTAARQKSWFICLWQHFNQETYRRPRAGGEHQSVVPRRSVKPWLVSSVLAGCLGGIHWHLIPELSAVFASCWGAISLLLNIFGSKKKK